MFSLDLRTYSLMFADEGFFRARECVSHFRPLLSQLPASNRHSDMSLDQCFFSQVQLGQNALMRQPETGDARIASFRMVRSSRTRTSQNLHSVEPWSVATVHLKSHSPHSKYLVTN